MELDTKQVELIATSWLESILMRQGFEVARPVRDKGIDLIVYLDNSDDEFSATPIQIKSAQGKTFSIQRKYEDRGIVMAYIWGATGDNPTLFLVPYDDAVDLLELIGNAAESASWKTKKQYSTQAPSKKLFEALSKYKNKFEVLRPARG